MARWSATNSRAVLLIISKGCDLTSELWSFQEQRQLLWKCTSDALTAFLVPLKSSSPLLGPQWHRHTQQSPAGACSEQVLRLFVEHVEREHAGLRSPRKRGCAGELSRPPSPLAQGPGRLCSHTPKHRRAPHGTDPAFRGETHNPEYSIKSKIFSRTLNRIRGHRTTLYGSIAAPMQRSEKHTIYSACKKYRLLARRQLKTSAFTGQFWFSFLPSFLPPLHPACTAWSPSGREIPTKVFPCTRNKELSSGLTLPIAIANTGKEDENGIWTNMYCTYNCLLI